MSGASTLRTWWYELALYTAWHTAAFAAQAMAGKLGPWSEYRARVVHGDPERAAPGPSWQVQKAERQRQMNLHRRHLAQRGALTRKPAHG
jgi:hypothetical protein